MFSTRFNRGKSIQYSITTLLFVFMAVCVFLGLWSQFYQGHLYSPIPTAAYAPDITPYEFSDTDFLYPRDPRPSALHVNIFVQAIEKRIVQLREQGDKQSADEMKAELDEIMNHHLGWPYPESSSIERLHAIGLYEGDKNIRGNAKVHVTDTSGPVVLALLSNEAVNWQISVDRGVTLKRVIVCGREKSNSVTGLPAETAVEGNFNGREEEEYSFYAFDPAGWVAGSRLLKKITGLDVATRQGEYRFEGTPYEIGPGSVNWSRQTRARMLLPLYRKATLDEMRALAAKLSKHSFPVIHKASFNQYGEGDASFATASIFGPYVETMQPLQDHRVGPLVYLPNGPSFFAMRGHELVAINPESGHVKVLYAPRIREAGHAPAIALDHESNRLYVWGQSMLMSIELRTRKVTEHRKGSPGVHALTYSATKKCLHALCSQYSGTSRNVVTQLKTLNLRGAEIETIDLSVPIAPTFREQKMALVEVADKIVLMPQMTFDANGDATAANSNYIIDPGSGEVLMVCKRIPR